MAFHVPSRNPLTSKKRKDQRERIVTFMSVAERELYMYRARHLKPEDLTPLERIRVQEQMLLEYLDKLDKKGDSTRHRDDHHK